MPVPLALSPKVITVDREHFHLDLYALRIRRYRRIRRYPIAVGAIGHTTPHGVYFIESKSRNPDWLHDGEIIPFSDPRNPFSIGFMSLAESRGIGIHGVRFDAEIGSRASHGCIRMKDFDILNLWDKVPIGTLVYIH